MKKLLINYLHKFFCEHTDMPIIITCVKSNLEVIEVYDCVIKNEINMKGDLLISFKSNTQKKITEWKFNFSKILTSEEKTKNLKIWVLDKGNCGSLIYPPAYKPKGGYRNGKR